MWKSLLLGLLVSLHTRIFLVFMRNYEAKSPLFMIKRAGLNYVPRQSYSKNSHGSYILKWILDRHASNPDKNWEFWAQCSRFDHVPVLKRWAQLFVVISN